MNANYRLTCTACPNYSVSTDDGYEATRLRQFHLNHNNNYRAAGPVHEVRIAASRAMPPTHVQAHIEDTAVPA